MTTPAAPDITRRRIASLALIGLATLVAAGTPLWVAHDAHWSGAWFAFAAAYSLILAGAGVLAFCRSTGAQLFARSVWWSTFGAGALVAVFAAEDRGIASIALVMVLANSTSLLTAGRGGLDHANPRDFAPAAYRAPIMVSMILALADAQALGWLGASRFYTVLRLSFEPISTREVQQAIAMTVLCAVSLCALYGLYKLRLWGLVLSAATTLAIGVLAFTPVLGMSDAGPIPYAFAVSAAVQIALLGPLFVAIVRRRAPSPASPRVARFAAIAPAVVILFMAALSVVTVATSHSLVKF